MLDHFRLAKFRFTLKAMERLNLPPYKGNVLRGGFGHTFKRVACTNDGACGPYCQRANHCPYGYIFETSPPAESKFLSKNQDVPMPFVLEPALDKKSLYQPGERLHFDLVLMGQALDYLVYFIVTFRELGLVGLGAERSRYQLEQVTNYKPPESQIVIYRAETEIMSDDQRNFNWGMVQARAAALSPQGLTVEFLTPTRLKHEGRWMERGPSFQAFFKVLLGRISSLSYFHCGQELAVDFRGLIDRAAQVQIVQSDTQWEDWSRFSGRQKQQVDMGGLVGRITYAGDLSDYLPFLALGELIHVGKGAVFGNGRYQIIDQ